MGKWQWKDDSLTGTQNTTLAEFAFSYFSTLDFLANSLSHANQSNKTKVHQIVLFRLLDPNITIWWTKQRFNKMYCVQIVQFDEHLFGLYEFPNNSTVHDGDLARFLLEFHIRQPNWNF